MEIFLRRIDGLDDAIITMFLSKRTLTRELEMEIRREVRKCSAIDAIDLGDDMTVNFVKSMSPKLNDWMKTLLKWGKRHITMLKFIDLSFMVYGMHRAGQDDIDSHAKRMDNRIIRSSTRLADFSDGEKSSYYEDKILTTDEALQALGIDLPDSIVKGDVKYVRAVNGYIKSGMEQDKDVKRGLYMLSIPSNFIFKINLAEFAHVYKERGVHGTANPEVKECFESAVDQLEAATFGYINRVFLMEVKN